MGGLTQEIPSRDTRLKKGIARRLKPLAMEKAKRVEKLHAPKPRPNPEGSELKSIQWFGVVYPNRKFDVGARDNMPKEEREIRAYAEVRSMPFRFGAVDEVDMKAVAYAVRPFWAWNKMKLYNNFIVEQETYRMNDYVYVCHDEMLRESKDPKDFWIARLLEVRASAPSHVFALVAWMWWPHELPVSTPRAVDQLRDSSGKRSYHGWNELIASNYLEVVSVSCFAAKVEVVDWHREDDSFDPAYTELPYWRQVYDKNTGNLSQLLTPCVCKAPRHPDYTMYICDNKECSAMLHAECITYAAELQKYELLSAEQQDDSQTSLKKKGLKRKRRHKMKAALLPWDNMLKADIIVREKAAEPGVEELRLVLENLSAPHTDGEEVSEGREKRVKRWEQDVCCLRCGTVVKP